MGQYHVPASLESGEALYSHPLGDGLKLMEFGYSWEVLGLDDDGDDTEGVGPTELFHGSGHTVEQALRDANWPEECRR